MIILILEVLIAVFIKDRFIRPYGGDILVVILLYFFVKAFASAPQKGIAIGVLAFSFIVEISQYYRLVELLNLQKNKFAIAVLGNSYRWLYLVMYCIGLLLALLIDLKVKVK